MDDFERASNREMLDRELSIAQQRAKNQPIKFTGRCLHCNEQIKAGRFCPQEDCGEQWEFEQKMRGIMGR